MVKRYGNVLVELANNAKIITWINNYVEHYAVGEA
jgi:hypothetical protein